MVFANRCISLSFYQPNIVVNINKSEHFLCYATQETFEVLILFVGLKTQVSWKADMIASNAYAMIKKIKAVKRGRVAKRAHAQPPAVACLAIVTGVFVVFSC